MKGVIEWIRRRGSLRSLARWLLLATLIAAPWLYGGTTALSIELIDGMLGLTLTFWVASLLVDRRWPMVPLALVVIGCVILLQGWWMVVNAHAIYDSAFGLFLPLDPIAPGIAGSADYTLSFAWMVRASALIGVVFMATEIAQRPVWLLRLWYTIALAGGSIGLLGLLQKASGAKMIFWGPPVWPPTDTFFATFFYHANAGAFLNLVFPVVAGLAIWAINKYRNGLMRTVPAIGALIVVASICANTSRMSQLVGALIALVLVVALSRPLARRVARMEKQTVVIAILMGTITLFAIAQASHLDRSWQRWQQFRKQLPVDERWVANRVAFQAIGEAGALGFGPGAFRAVFPHYEAAAADIHGIWRFLHDDYLQTVLEWGWLGSLLIGLLFFGGIGIGLRSYLRAGRGTTRQHVLLPCTLLALIGVAIHASVDFPLQIFSIQLLAAMYLGLCWGSGWRKGRIKN